MQVACNHTLVQCLGIEFTEIGADFVEARMPVDERTMQPMGLLHGGASAALAETLGGAGAYLAVPEGRATPIHIGRTTQVWNIAIRDEQDNPICISRLTVAVRKP
jgi:1,4-dihydroxy-2-naphthoyl-CoA hydrolase